MVGFSVTHSMHRAQCHALNENTLNVMAGQRLADVVMEAGSCCSANTKLMACQSGIVWQTPLGVSEHNACTTHARPMAASSMAFHMASRFSHFPHPEAGFRVSQPPAATIIPLCSPLMDQSSSLYAPNPPHPRRRPSPSAAPVYRAELLCRWRSRGGGGAGLKPCVS